MSAPSLLELQRSLRAALLDGDAAVLLPLIVGDRVAPDERLNVYRNNVGASLTAALKSTFPVICRLVDERFFAYAAQAFIGGHPPAAPCLTEYGASFPDFLATFPPCREMAYLADVARLEWSLHRVAHAPGTLGLSAATLQAVPPALAPRLVFRLAPSYAYVASPWPIDRIWRTNRAGAQDEMIDLYAGGAGLEIRRHAGEVEMRGLPSADFAFRQALSRGRPLAAAIDAALMADQMFAVSPALSGLIAEGALVEYTIEGEYE